MGTGGTTASGGTLASGGTQSGSGGATASGGTQSSSGGSTSSGGQSSSDGGASSGGGGSDGLAYNPDFVEFYGEDCPVTEPANVDIDTLPDLFEKLDGTRMTQKAEWRCRRAELKRVMEKYLYGTKPGAPDVVTGSVSATSISVHVEHGGGSLDFDVGVSLPTGASGPVPIVIGLGGVSSFGGTANLAQTIKDEGVATGSYDHNGMAAEGTKSGLFDNVHPTGDISVQIAWAWGFSRIIDVLVMEKEAGRNDIIDPTGVAVTGCSRNGKGAFTIGAFDERIALGLPQESGTAGVSAVRIVATSPSGPNGQPAEPLNNGAVTQAGWFSPIFQSMYRTNLSSIPGDTHSMVAMYAPRGLLVIDNSRIGELCSTCQHAASVAGGEVFKALGVEKNVAYHGGRPTDPQEHCGFYTEQVEPLQRAIRGHLTRTEAPDGRMEPQPAGTADLDEWIQWETPTLE